MAIEGALLALETASRSGGIDTRREILQRVTSKTDPQNMWMLEVGKSSDAGRLEFECVGFGSDLLQFGLEDVDVREGNRRSEEFQRQM